MTEKSGMATKMSGIYIGRVKEEEEKFNKHSEIWELIGKFP